MKEMVSATPGVHSPHFRPDPTSVTEPIPNGDRFSWSPMATTLIYDEQDAVLIDPPLTTGQAQRVRD
jgi:hypothetical protein